MPNKYDDFTLVTRKIRGSNRKSSVFYHIHNNRQAVFTDPQGSGLIKSIKAPTKNCQAYLLLLSSNPNNKSLSSTAAFTERHIRIDECFGTPNSNSVQIEFKSHWHYTETYGTLTVHVYFDYNTCITTRTSGI
jgi:hypothetical protein